MDHPSFIAITSRFRHHASYGGYIRLLEYLKPAAVFGVDETKPGSAGIMSNYPWLYEFRAAIKQIQVRAELIHVLYGEDYFRFSARLFPNTPVITTFHQPEKLLLQEVERGSLRGRAGILTHLLTKSRFAKLSAAIILAENQRPILEKVMPADKIHLIPHGVDIKRLHEQSAGITRKSGTYILTVGQWLRDWDLYFKVVEEAAVSNPDWKFVLVNRSLPEQYRKQLPQFPNVDYRDNIADNDLIRLYCESTFLFLPLRGATANNAMVESLALGLPALTTSDIRSDYPPGEALASYTAGDAKDAMRNLKQMAGSSPEAYQRMSDGAREMGAKYDWNIIAVKIAQLYRQVSEKHKRK